eukprot:CAMPEP_0118950140 /NCGR_PEP_ID=MMETSP1169-20130426/50852_1 /TAXON_ID=36882 /ORGANISM="Pyramimonas obovata, Strain CCMP722" /LENGTH=225 /DNA_ID=CAMNT_0006896919 /DNA_START=57 /DNA_END=731 /DNA_ORIENTATION=+
MAEARSEAGESPVPPSAPSVTDRPSPLEPAGSGVSEHLPERLQFLLTVEKDYETRVRNHPTDTEALFNWAQVLQEKATRFTRLGTTRDSILHYACDKYEAIVKAGGASHDVHYNWGVALSDRAKLFAHPERCRELWVAAQQQYDAATHHDPRSVQAHNNRGLALRHVAALTPPPERASVTHQAIQCFRRAIYLQNNFDRAIYNLGTVLHKEASEEKAGERKQTSQ